MTISAVVTLIAVGLLSTATAETLPPQHGHRVVCYVSIIKDPFDGSWFNSYDAEPALQLCTHIIFPCVVLRGLDIVTYEVEGYNTTENIQHLTSLKAEKFPYVKIILGVGFLKTNRSEYAWMAETAERRSEFVQNVLDFVRVNNFDGADIGWNFAAFQHNFFENTENQVRLVKLFRQEFDKHWLSVSISCITSFDGTEIGVDNSGLAANAHFITLGTLSHKTFYRFVEREITLGVPPEKINFAVIGAGFAYKLNNPGTFRDMAKDVYDLSPSFTMNHDLLCQIAESGIVTEDVDFDTGHSYYYFKNYVVALDNAQVISLKISYAMNKTLGGVAFYSLDYDDYRGACAARGGKFPMLREIDRKLIEYSPSAYTDINNKLEQQSARYFWNGMKDESSTKNN